MKISRANSFQLYDMAGNVSEWCEDWYDANYYKSGLPRNLKGPATGTERVLRGASWLGLLIDFPQSIRCAKRNGGDPSIRNPNIGFRCAQDVR